MRYEEIIDGYHELREKCLEIAKMNDAALMDSSAWLRGAIMESDIVLDYSEQGIHCNGWCFTTQTMDNEHFSFIIPYNLLRENNA